MDITNLSQQCGALTSKELLEVLDKLFPDRCPHPEDSDRNIWIKVGKRQVVELMKQWFDRVEASALTVMDQNDVPQ